MSMYPFTTSALRVTQPLGTFYVAVLPAKVLLDVCASDHLRAKLDPNSNGYTLAGTQRLINDSRMNEIAAYVDSVDASFPNSIILAANNNYGTGFDQDETEDVQPNKDKSLAWSVEKVSEEI